jgi:hypothetical protein
VRAKRDRPVDRLSDVHHLVLAALVCSTLTAGINLVVAIYNYVVLGMPFLAFIAIGRVFLTTAAIYLLMRALNRLRQASELSRDEAQFLKQWILVLGEDPGLVLRRERTPARTGCRVIQGLLCHDRISIQRPPRANPVYPGCLTPS